MEVYRPPARIGSALAKESARCAVQQREWSVAPNRSALSAPRAKGAFAQPQHTRAPFVGKLNTKRRAVRPVVADGSVWAERESNPHSQRRLIYSQRRSSRQQTTRLLEIPRI